MMTTKEALKYLETHNSNDYKEMAEEIRADIKTIRSLVDGSCTDSDKIVNFIDRYMLEGEKG